ncbi:hypothetical protein LSH36_1082g00031 [Paralvinella palmiformis]|uniref:Mitochondrial carrier protein n=1 Tax=Paralvinella palmiformis TaxID=53620 RepID=A0AAD9IWG0_9ANNE|nr:hypothetical protein LSH36_1082g00031 [Paralvinella palmiformis]
MFVAESSEMKTDYARNDAKPKKHGPIEITPVQQMFSSCFGAVITSFIVTPLDVVKIRLQAQQQPLKQGKCFIYHNGLMDCLCLCSRCNSGSPMQATVKTDPWYYRPSKFSGTLSCELHSYKTAATEDGYIYLERTLHLNGTMDAFAKIAKSEGITSLWSGLPPTLIMSIPATVFYFTAYEHLKHYMGYCEDNPATQYVPMLAGSAARVGTVYLVSPLELIRTKMQSQQLSYRDLGRAVCSSVKHGGILSLWRGVGPTLLRDVPFSSIYWFSYEYVKLAQLRHQGNEEVTFLQSFIAGATAGTIAAFVTLPFDVVKTQRQIELGQTEVVKNKKFISTYRLISELYKSKGVPALFTGLVPRVSKVAPACAIMISSYEYFKAFFKRHNAAKAQLAVKDWS